MSKSRIRIPQPIQDKVLLASEFKCCICRSEKGICLHHINEDPSDNREANLACLCSIHHSKAHTLHKLEQNLTPTHIRKSKQAWESAVSLAKADRVSLNSNNSLSIRYWTYHNIPLLASACEHAGISIDSIPQFSTLLAEQVIDKYGIATISTPTVEDSELKTIYSSVPQYTAQLLNRYYSSLTDELIRISCPTQVNLSWRKQVLKRILEPSRLIYLSRLFHFRVLTRESNFEVREMHCSANGFKVSAIFDTRSIFSNSSLHSHFRGNNVVSGLFLVRSATKSDSNPRHINTKLTPIALGTGFPTLSGAKPDIAYQMESEDVDDIIF